MTCFWASKLLAIMQDPFDFVVGKGDNSDGHWFKSKGVSSQKGCDMAFLCLMIAHQEPLEFGSHFLFPCLG
jgi:hypothetical protein